MNSLSASSKRTLIRTLHLGLALPIGALIYAPESVAMALRPAVQFALFPVVAVSGLLMWQGTRLRKYLLRRKANTEQVSRKAPSSARLQRRPTGMSSTQGRSHDALAQ